jgi:hypothetical protein
MLTSHPGSLLRRPGLDPFPSTDEIKHCNRVQIGDFLKSLLGSPLAEIHLVLDGKKEIHNQGHVLLVSNMPYAGFHSGIMVYQGFLPGYA